MRVLAEKEISNGAVIQIVLGDLTDETVDAIVNAANQELVLGDGVAGAIRRKGGGSIQRECDAIGEIPTGHAVLTGAGNLPSRFVIHAVGPVWGGGAANEESLLASAVRNSLLTAEEHGLTSIAIPAISSGIFGFPKRRCAEIILATILDVLRSRDRSLKIARCTNIDETTARIFLEVFQSIPEEEFQAGP